MFSAQPYMADGKTDLEIAAFDESEEFSDFTPSKLSHAKTSKVVFLTSPLHLSHIVFIATV